jgi:hypothetical protein
MELGKSSVGVEVHYECGGNICHSTTEPQPESVWIAASE